MNHRRCFQCTYIFFVLFLSCNTECSVTNLPTILLQERNNKINGTFMTELAFIGVDISKEKHISIFVGWVVDIYMQFTYADQN